MFGENSTLVLRQLVMTVSNPFLILENRNPAHAVPNRNQPGLGTDIDAGIAALFPLTRNRQPSTGEQIREAGQVDFGTRHTEPGDMQSPPLVPRAPSCSPRLLRRRGASSMPSLTRI